MSEKSASRQAPKESQNWISKQIMTGFALCTALFLGAYFLLPIPTIQIQTPVDRFVLTIRCLFVSSLPILLLIRSVANARFSTRAIDPVKGGGEDIVDVPNRILRNTIEQYIMHAVSMLTLCTFLDEASLKIIPILSVNFVIFRLLFWWGYLNSPLNRAVGMSGTGNETRSSPLKKHSSSPCCRPQSGPSVNTFVTQGLKENGLTDRDPRGEMRSFPEDRQFVVRAGLAGVIFTILFSSIGYLVLPFSTPSADSILVKLVYTLRWQMFPAFMLLFGVLSVMYLRFQSSAINPVLGRGEHIVETHQRYLRNTTEQLGLHVIGQLVLCTYLTSQSLAIIPVCSTLFVIGRIAFWVGYVREPLKRMFGFMVTFSVTLGSLLYCLFCFVMSGPTFTLHD